VHVSTTPLYLRPKSHYKHYVTKKCMSEAKVPS